jgi:hypothetical protein
VVSSYTPTLSALLNAQNKARTAPSHLDILAIGKDARALPAMPQLQFVESELTTVEDTAKASKHDCSVDSIPQHATVEGVTARIQTTHFVSCTGNISGSPAVIRLRSHVRNRSGLNLPSRCERWQTRVWIPPPLPVMMWTCGLKPALRR